MLSEENESVLQGLVASINDIEQGSNLYNPPSLENVDVNANNYTSAKINDDDQLSTTKRVWLRPFLAGLGVLMLLGVVGLVAATMWCPADQMAMKRDNDKTTMTIEIEVWDGEVPSNCSDEPLCLPSTNDQIQKHFGDAVDPINASPSANVNK